MKTLTAANPNTSRGEARAHVLVIDDDIHVCRALNRTLRAGGYDATMCLDANKGLEMAREIRPDIILLDLVVLEKSGWQFRVEQKRDPLLADIPVIAIFADASPQAQAIDADARIAKPIDTDHLLASLARLLCARERQALEAQAGERIQATTMATLASGVAHEINNPLTFVLGNMEVAQRVLANTMRDHAKEEGSPLRENLMHVDAMLARAVNGAERIRDIVRCLVPLSRWKDGPPGLVDVSHVLQQALDVVRAQITERAALITEFARVPQTCCHASKLSHMFVNLLVNAAQAIADEHPERNEICVSIGFESERQTIVVRVQDTGCGIEPDVLERVFDPFFTTRPYGQGMGLGLFICRQVVTELGGVISVKSRLGTGTTFRVEIPVIETRVIQGPDVPSDACSAASSGKSHPGTGRVLVIDDEELVGSLLGAILRQRHEVVVVTSAEQAQQCITEGKRFDVIFTDVAMPNMNGLQLHRWLRTFAPDQANKVVFMSGGGVLVSELEELISSSDLALLSKPFMTDEVLDLVDKRVAQAPQSQQTEAHLAS